MKYIFTHLMIPLILTAQLLSAGDGDLTILTIDEVLEPEIKRLSVDIEFGFGQISLERGNPAKAVTGFIQFDDEYLRPDMEYTVSGSRARFTLETETRHRSWGMDDMSNKIEDTDCELYFSPRVPLEIDFSCGLGEASLDLGDLRIEDLNIENGLGETRINFSTLNRVEMDYLHVENGLGELTALNLSNANCDRMTFDCGLGEATLDFNGEKLRDMRVSVNVGLGSVIIIVPAGYNVELRSDESFLSSIDHEGLIKVDRGLYRSPAFESDKPTLKLKTTVGLGSVELRWSD